MVLVPAGLANLHRIRRTWRCKQTITAFHGDKLYFPIQQTHALIPKCTLDVEPRRVLLHVPALYDLDINLESLDSELVSIFGKNNTADAALKLKRMRKFDVDNASAEWRVADKAIVLVA